MNVGLVAYGNGLMIGVFCGWTAFGLAFGPLLALFCCSASSGKYPTQTNIPVAICPIFCYNDTRNYPKEEFLYGKSNS